MRIVSTFSLLAVMASISISCRQESQQPGERERAYLRPLLHIGDSTTNVIAKFGAPDYQYVTGTHELAMYFHFPESDKAALAAGVGGFTGFFTNNQLESWDPIYRR